MARDVTWGAPSRSPHYEKLRSKYAFFGIALLLGFVAFGFLGLFQLVGFRSPISPGSVTSSHSGIQTRCESCHAHGRASDLRCERCHDGGGAGRLTLASHVFFGSQNARKAASASSLDCAHCHVEHKGATVRLASVKVGECLDCHAVWAPPRTGQTYSISSLAKHPEFMALREHLNGDPRILFSHKEHMKPLIKEGASGEWDTCARCHVPAGASSDLKPLDYEQHCARCHSESELTMDPVPAQDVQADVPGASGGVTRGADGSVQKTGIRHKDEWFLFNLRRLQSQLYPAAYSRDRDSLLSRASQLERQLYQAQPLSGQSVEALIAREAGVREEVRRLEFRALTKKVSPKEGLERLGEISAATAGDPGLTARIDELSKEAASLNAPATSSSPIPPGELEDRRRELQTLLDALLAADPNRKRSVEDLRRRLVALGSGEATADNLQRAIAQRQLDLERLRDEISLRDATPVEIRTLPEQVALARELDEVRTTLTKYYAAEGTPPELNPADRARKLDTLMKITGAGGKGERCAKCHILKEGSFLSPRAARSIMVRATFVHGPHLDAPLPGPSLWTRIVSTFQRDNRPSGVRTRCAYCHGEIVKAADAPRPPSIPGVQSCRECHRSGATRADCLICHRYHPPGAGV